ncbi:MAG TPA: Hint domain-containing protein [Candidatus Limnocylindria bacterium]|nr:Hint domain-containing protein [Candidatus Limnocylindria bacterium]
MRLILAAAFLVAACGGSPLASPTPPPQPLTQPQLKYRVMDELGRPWFCDPDFFPVGRGDEGERAREKLPEIQKDADTFAAIVAHLKLPPAPPYTADQVLAIYREWKTLNVLQLQPTTTNVWGFTYLAMKNVGGGERVEGRVLADGSVSVLTRQQAGPPQCPICLALGTRIGTPGGERAVQGLRVGDVVWTLDAAGDRLAVPLVATGKTPVPSDHQVVSLALDDGRLVLVSPGHPTSDGRRVGDLSVGDKLDGARIASVARVTYAGGATYDVLPAGATGAYWANGVLLRSTLRAQ